MSQLPCPTEFEEGKILVAYLRTRGFMFTHIPNETGHDDYAKRRAIRMKQQGTSKGFPDYVILLPQINAILVVELKRQRGSSVTPEQRAWVKAFCEISNCEGIIAKGAKDAIDFIENLLKNAKAASKTQEILDSQPF